MRMLCRRLVMRFATGFVLGFALLAVFGCAGSGHDTDQLTKGRENLKHQQVACGADTAVAGVAGVYANPDTVYLEDWIVVSVCHLDKLRAEADKAQKPITLYIQGIDSGVEPAGVDADRKSTRLNSSHQIISYAVFCLKKKK